MKTNYVLGFFLLFIFSYPLELIGQSNSPDIENTNISILTCRSGDELYSTFGHTAIRIYNSEAKLDIVYNYGVFSFNTPNFYLKFMRGKLPYYLGASKTDSFLREYNYDMRSVIEQELILNNDQKKDIIQFLVENAKPENREYKYDFFYDNCATRVVDVYSSIADVSYSNSIELKTFRQLLKENLQSLVWSDFGIDLVIGARADRIADRRGQMFLPEYVMQNLESASIGDSVFLAKQPYLVLDFEEQYEEREKKSTNWPLIVTILILIITLSINYLELKIARIYNKTILIGSGILGLLLLFMWFGTEHQATRDNWNLLWLSPLNFIYLATNGKGKKVLYYVILALLGIAAINCLFTYLPQFFNIAFLPIILSITVAIYKEFQVADRSTAAA